MGSDETTLIRAAGGVIWKRSPEGDMVAVIHRARYDDWCLPKGKLKPRESWKEAALREVREETGCEARIRNIAGIVSYKVNNAPKLVYFFNMDVSGECLFEASEEVKEIVWLSPMGALNRLTYKGEKEVLSMNMSLRGKGLFRWFRGQGSERPIRTAHTSYSRLRSGLETFAAESDAMIKKKNADKTPWAEGLRDLLAQAQVFINKENDIDAAWRCFHAARRMAVFGYDKNELSNEILVLRREAEKLKEWRKKAIHDLIGLPDAKKGAVAEDIDPQRVYQALSLRDEHYANIYLKITHRRRNLKIVGVVLLGAIVLLPALAFFGLLPSEINDWKKLLAIELFGILGASFTTALTLTRSSLDDKIPDQVISTSITWLRPAIGAAAALAAYVLLSSKLLQAVISSNLAGSTEGLLAVAFIAGFSERLVIKAITGATSEKDKKKEA